MNGPSTKRPLSFDDAVRRESLESASKTIAQTIVDEFRKHGPDPEVYPLMIMATARAINIITEQVQSDFRDVLIIQLLTKSATAGKEKP